MLKGKRKNTGAIGIIGGADGPTAVFGGGVELPLRWRIKNGIRQYVYRCKRKRAEKKIAAGTHTLEETVAYAVNTYGAVQISRNKKTSPSVSRVYEIKEAGADFHLEIVDEIGWIGVSFSGDSKTAKRYEKIARDIYLYYGVSGEDIRNKTERYHNLVSILST